MAASLMTVAACTSTPTSAHSEHVSKATFSGLWPVSADAGTLTCYPDMGDSITFTPDGSTIAYAENGTAMDRESTEGWHDFREIWLDDPDGLGPKVNATAFDNEGHKLCR